MSFRDEVKEAVREVLREELPAILRELARAPAPTAAPRPARDGLLSLNQAAAWLGFHPKTLVKWTNAGVLAASRPGGEKGRWRFKLEDLEAFKNRGAANELPTYAAKRDATLLQLQGNKKR